MKCNLKEEEMIINGSVVKSIHIGLGNMESYAIPIECFEYIEINPLEEKVCEFSCRVIDNGKIDSSYADKGSTFAQRVSKYNDITDITFVCEDGSEHRYETVWYYGTNDEEWYKFDQVNLYQKTTFHSYKEVEISVAKSNKKYTLGEVLSIGTYEPTLFEDEFGITYKAKDGFLFVIDEEEPIVLSLDILNAEFIKVD